MESAIIYIHGKGGSAEEAVHYIPLFPNSEVIGFDYQAKTPWEAKKEFPDFFDFVKKTHSSVSVIANSIGAFFAMGSLNGKNIDKGMFISPIVNMEKLITDMLDWENLSEKQLCTEKEIVTSFGEVLSWEYLLYVRANIIEWNVPTKILYGSKDNLTSYETISNFANKIGASLTVMEDGEHWFHTEKQMEFLDDWITR